MIPSFSLPCSLKPWSACECKHVLGLRLGSSKASPDNVFSCYRSTLSGHPSEGFSLSLSAMPAY